MKVIVLLERTVEISLLFDYYGRLLTERQQQIIKLYYFYDLSLSEVSKKLDISRQGVYDHLHRAEEILRKYEDKLKLVNKFSQVRNNLDELYQFVDEVLPLEEKNEKKDIKPKILSRINKLKEKV